MAGDRFHPFRNRWQSWQLHTQGNSMRWILSFLLLATAAPCLAKQLADRAPRLPEPTDALKTITAEQARSIVQDWVGEVRLNGLTSISPEVAEELARIQRWLHLDGLTSITPEVAAKLGDASCGVNLNGLGRLEPDVAKQLAKLGATLQLDGLTSLSPESAVALAAHKGRLGLNGLTSLNAEVLTALLRHDGPVELNGVIRNIAVLNDARLAKLLASGILLQATFDNLSELSAEAANAMQGHGVFFEFPKLKNLSPATADALVGTDGTLVLNGVEVLEPGVAQSLSRSRGRLPDLFLNGLKSISAVDAETLGKKNGTLGLSGLKALTPQVAQHLAKHRGGPLLLNGVTSLDVETAVALATSQGAIHLGVHELTAETAKALASGTSQRWLTLTGLKSLDPLAAELLVNNQHLSLYLPTLKPVDISPRLSAVFAKAKCLLGLTGIYELTPELARDIGFYSSRVELTNLTTITLEQARLLSPNSGSLEFPAIERLDDAVLRQLAQNKGRLTFHFHFVHASFARGMEGHEGTLAIRYPTHFMRTVGTTDKSVWFGPDAFESLLRHRGPLVLPDLDVLSEAQEEQVTRREKTIVLFLKEVSPKALEAWKQNPNVRLVTDFENK
jgi:hypothetical protein